MEIDKYIQTLLYDYDCVILPQLGGFISNYRPATTDLNTGICHPPGKDIRFNKNLTKSDGLLERAVADGAKINFEDAGLALKEVTNQYWSQLNDGQKVKFKRIGVLYVDDHKNLHFEPAPNENYLKSAFGFESFTLLPAQIIASEPINKEIETQVIPMEKEPAETETEHIPFRSGKSIYWVAAATLLPFIAMSLYMGLTTNFKSPTELTLAEFFPFNSLISEMPKFSARTAFAEAETRENDGTGFPINTAIFPFSFETNRVDSTGVWIDLKKTEARVPEKTSTLGKYHIIAGCFGEEMNAAKYVFRLKNKGYSASILDYHKNLHRVRIESFNDYSTAIQKLQNLRNNGTFPNAWLLKKPQP